MKKIIYVIVLVLQMSLLTSEVFAEKLSSVLGKTCIIRSAMNNDYVIDVYYMGTENGTNIQLYHYNGVGDSGEGAQKFVISSAGNGYYRIVNTNSNKAIDVSGGVAGNEVNVHLWEWNGTDAQLFKFEDAGNGFYYIKNKLGYYLDVYGAKCENWTNIQTYKKNGGNNQKWLLTSWINENTQKKGILNASWEVDLTNEISFEEIKTSLNPFAYNIFNESGYGDEVKYPTPGKKYLVRIDYIDSDTVFEMIRHKSLNRSVLEQIKELIAGDAKNAGIEKIAITILNGIGVKNVPGISTLVGVLEIFASANEQKDWNNFAKTTQNGQGIKKYTYVNFSRTIPDSSPSGLYPGIPNFHYSIISYKTYHYELWDGQANDLSDLTTAVMMSHTGKWTYKYK